MDLEPLPPQDPAAAWTLPPAPDGLVDPPAPSRWTTRTRIAAIAAGVATVGAMSFAASAFGSGRGSPPAPATNAAATNAAASGPLTLWAQAKPRHGAGFGTVSNLNGPDFTVSISRNGTTRTTNVVTDANTSFTKTVKGAVGDIKVGDHVVVGGTRAANGSLNASLIQIMPAGFGGKGARSRHPEPPAGGQGAVPKPSGRRPDVAKAPFAAGVVKSIGSGSFVLTGRGGRDQTVTTGSNPTVIETVKAALSDVTNGATAAVAGTPTTDDKSVLALRVDIVDPALVGRDRMFFDPGFGRFGHGGRGIRGGWFTPAAPPAPASLQSS